MKGLAFFRPLLPSWRFFDDAPTESILQYRIFENEVWKDWENANARPKRKIQHFFVNAEGNTFLALQSLLEQLHAEMESAGMKVDAVHFDQLISFQLIKNLVMSQIESSKGKSFQIRILVHASATQSEAILLSSVYAV
jgi:hypothetical protein